MSIFKSSEYTAHKYEYGVIDAYGEHNATDIADTINEAMEACEELEKDWSGCTIGTWIAESGQIVASTCDINERWYIRCITW